MKKFSDLVKDIREQSGLSQNEFAIELGVSSIYISKIETDQKEVSKKFLSKLADFTGVHPSALAPFLYLNDDINPNELSPLERKLISLGEQLQSKLIKKKVLSQNENSN